jgi:hypothetical protein
VSQALEQVIELQLEERTGAELSNAYRALCCAMLIHTAQTLTAKQTTRKEAVKNRSAARNWTDGKRGVVTFEDACDAVDLCPESFAKRLDEYVSSNTGGTIITGGKYANAKRPRRHYVFGRSCHHAIANESAASD